MIERYAAAHVRTNSKKPSMLPYKFGSLAACVAIKFVVVHLISLYQVIGPYTLNKVIFQ